MNKPLMIDQQHQEDVPEDARLDGFSKLGTMFAMLLGILGSLVLMQVSGRLQVAIDPDSRSYLDFDFSTWHSTLSGIRTPGYPIFLRAIQGMGGIDAVPYAQWGALVAAVALFCWSLLKVGVSRGVAVGASLVLLFSHAAWEFARTIGTDSLAISIAVAAAAMFFWNLSSTKIHWVSILLLALLTWSAYWVRPAFLFLIVLWPTLGAWLEGLLLHRGIRAACKRGMVLSLATCLPFIGYCGLRKAIVGEFGFVSFAGYNLIGIGGQFLDVESTERLSEDLRPLAKGVIAKRSAVPEFRTADSFEAMVDMYNPTIWRMAVPAAEEIHPGEVARINRDLQRLALESIRMNRSRYRSWLISNSKHAMDQVLSLTVVDRGVRILLLAFSAWMFFQLISGAWSTSKVGDPAPQSSPSRLRFDLQLFFWLALVFALGKTLLVVSVEPALGRYVMSAMLFFPSLVAAALWHLAVRIADPRIGSN